MRRDGTQDGKRVVKGELRKDQLTIYTTFCRLIPPVDGTVEETGRARQPHDIRFYTLVCLS